MLFDVVDDADVVLAAGSTTTTTSTAASAATAVLSVDVGWCVWTLTIAFLFAYDDEVCHFSCGLEIY